ncbi:MAG TPA: PEP-CTERM sorting domain-containing protein [Pirellulales bacterium]|nr:PEP-CTERM sorting domain-containing protein [Pirellulales bacterium]
MPRSFLHFSLVLAGLLTSWCSLSGDASADISFSVEITDTAALVPAGFTGPFALDFQFADGEGTGDMNNTVTISNFVFGGTGSGDFAGAVVNPLGLPGAPGGTVSSGQIAINDSQFLNEVWLPFTPGSDPGDSSISFTVSMTTALDASGVADLFAFGILQQVDTALLKAAGIDTEDSQGIPPVFPGFLTIAATDPAQFPLTGYFITPPSQGTTVPGVAVTPLGSSSVPEPATFSLFAVGVVGLVAGRRRRPKG